jgi:hypothetical protein
MCLAENDEHRIEENGSSLSKNDTSKKKQAQFGKKLAEWKKTRGTFFMKNCDM